MTARPRPRPPTRLAIRFKDLSFRQAAERILDELRDESDLEVVDVKAAGLSEALPDLRTRSPLWTRPVKSQGP